MTMSKNGSSATNAAYLELVMGWLLVPSKRFNGGGIAATTLSPSDCRDRATVQDVVDAADECGALGGEKRHEFRDFFRFARTSHGNAAQHVHDRLTGSVLADAPVSSDIHDHSVCAG